MYDLPGRTDVGRVVIDADTVRDKVNPTLVPRETPNARHAGPRADRRPTLAMIA